MCQGSCQMYSVHVRWMCEGNWRRVSVQTAGCDTVKWRQWSSEGKHLTNNWNIWSESLLLSNLSSFQKATYWVKCTGCSRLLTLNKTSDQMSPSTAAVVTHWFTSNVYHWCCHLNRPCFICAVNLWVISCAWCTEENRVIKSFGKCSRAACTAVVFTIAGLWEHQHEAGDMLELNTEGRHFLEAFDD